MSKIWEIHGDLPKASENPEVILRKYADRLKDDTANKFIGLVTELGGMSKWV